MSEHLLVGFDQSPQSRDALEYVLETFPDARVTVLYVSDPQEWIGDAESFDGLYSDDVQERAQETTQEVLNDAESIAAEFGQTIETDVAAGNPAKELVAYAEAHDVDHVFLGSHGRTGLQRVLIGSVAEQVVRRSTVPVTVMRSERE